MGFITLLLEITDTIREKEILLVVAGKIINRKRVTATLGIGAAGTAIGIRFLTLKEARIKKEILR